MSGPARAQQIALFLMVFAVSLAISQSARVWSRDSRSRPSRPKIQISVESALRSDRSWAERMCQTVLKAMSKPVAFDASCTRLDDFEAFSRDPIGEAQRSGEYRYQIQVRQTEHDRFRIGIENWAAREEDGEFRRIGWTVTDPERGEARLHALLARFSEQEAKQEPFKALILAAGLQHSARLKVKPDGSILDTVRGKSVSDREAYRIFAAESPKNLAFLRAASELTLSWGGPVAPVIAIPPGTGASMAGKLHLALQGSYEGRSLEEVLFTLAAAAVWERVTEFRKAVSVNDRLLSPLAGAVLGEVFRGMNEEFSVGNSLAGKVLPSLFASASEVNQLLDSGEPPGTARARLEGFRMPPRNRVAELEMLAISAGAQREVYLDKRVSELWARESKAADLELDLQTVNQVVFSAIRQKELAEGADGLPNSYSLSIGVNGGVPGQAKATRDWLASVNVVGSTVDYTIDLPGKLKMRAVVDLYGKVAVMRGMSVDRNAPAKLDPSGAPLAPLGSEYYYGWGIASGGAISVSHGNSTGGFARREQSFSSLEPYLRMPEVMAPNLYLESSRSEQEFWLSYKVGEDLKIRVSVVRREREGSLGGISPVRDVETVQMGTINYRF